MAETTGLAKVSKALIYLGTKHAIDTVCDVVRSDYAIMQIASAYELRNQPKAQFMLNYYIEGRGKRENVLVDTLLLIKEDNGVRQKIRSEIAAALARGAKDGFVQIKQSVYANNEWKNALGSINMQWRVLKNQQVELWFINRYRWHPNEARVSQCVHQAAENLKKRGASEFDMIGERIQMDFGNTPKFRLN